MIPVVRRLAPAFRPGSRQAAVAAAATSPLLGRRSLATSSSTSGPSNGARSPTSVPPTRSFRTPRILTASASTLSTTTPSTDTDMTTPAGYSAHGNFSLVNRVKYDHADVCIEKWVSSKTGLSVVHVNYESPLVSGHFAVRTEIFDDSGRPHTLEHLVFLGSEKYPYKGVLDNLANRAFSNGTNAWTDTDNTTYTITTAGQDGFLRLLPIYLDHILYPTMTDNGFVTEVHHINAKAEDAGVVYAEMQGREQTSGDLMALKLQRTFYPDGSAYRSETGGLMEALRVLTAERIREYHRGYYVPHNLCLIVAGRLDTKDLLDVLQNEVEPDLVKHGQTGPPAGWKRPFMETPSMTPPDIKGSTVTKTVHFPEKDESMGEVVMAVVTDGKDPLIRKARDILYNYLSDSPVSPLMKEFVEVASPLCSYIYFNDNIRSSFAATEIYLGGVPTEELKHMPRKFTECLKKVAKEGFDMERMAIVLKRDRLKYLNGLETASGDDFAMDIIDDFLHGATDGSDLPQMAGELGRFAELSQWTSDQWTSLLTKSLIDNVPVVVLGKPSASLPDKLEAEEKARIAAQKKTLGEDGLAKLVKELEDAKKEHERPIPQEMLTSFPVPPISSISWIPVQSAWNDPTDSVALPAAKTTNELQKHVEKDGKELPFFVEFDHIKSSFVTITAFLSVADVPPHLIRYLSTYLESFFTLPVVRSDGTRLAHEDVVKQLESLTVDYDAGLGVSNWFQNLMRVRLRVEVSQYENAVAWLKDLIYGAEFAKDRLEVSIAKILQNLPEWKRDGNTVLYAVSGDLLNDEKSASRAGGVTGQMEHIPELAQRLKDDPESVIADFKTIREAITKPQGVRFSVYGNVLGIQSPRSPWKVFDSLPETKLDPPPSAIDTLTELGKRPTKKAVVVTLPTIESTYALHTTKSISGFDHADQAALRVACEVLEATESYLWRYIRGSGLAYGANMAIDVEAGHLSFSVYKAPDSYRAFEEGRRVIQGLTDGSITMDDTVLDGAKSSLVFKAARGVSTPGSAATASFLNQSLKGVSQAFGRELLERMQAVTIEDVKRALKTYVLPLFDPATSVAVVVSSPAKAGEIAEQLGKAGFDVESRALDVGADEDSDDEMGSDSGSETDDSATKQ